MLGKLIAAQMSLEQAISELSRSGASTSAADGQLSLLGALQAAIGTAGATALAAMSGDIASAVAQSKILVDQAREQASAAGSASMTPRDARATVEKIGRDLFRNHVLDRYLDFTSEDDEKAYRKRERERQEEYERAIGLHTPEGDRRASELVHAQLIDAKDHGGDRAPEFDNLMRQSDAARRALDQSQQPQQSQLPANAVKPAISDDVAGIAATLRASGLTAPSTENEGHGLNFDKLAALSRASEGRG